MQHLIRGLRITRLVKCRGRLALRSEDSRCQMNPGVYINMDKYEMMAGIGHDRTMSMFVVHSASNESGPRFSFLFTS